MLRNPATRRTGVERRAVKKLPRVVSAFGRIDDHIARMLSAARLALDEAAAAFRQTVGS
jgi:hypothetical protein